MHLSIFGHSWIHGQTYNRPRFLLYIPRAQWTPRPFTVFNYLDTALPLDRV